MKTLLLLLLLAVNAYAWDTGGAWDSIREYLSHFNKHILPAADNTYDIGSETRSLRNIYVDGNIETALTASRCVETDADGTFVAASAACGTGGGNSFETMNVPAGTDPVADSSTDTLNITETSFLTITGTAGTDTIDITQVTTDLGTDGLIAANAVDSPELATDSVSADELNATGVEAELEAALDIGGEVTSTGMASTVVADTLAVTDWNLTTPTITTQLTMTAQATPTTDADGEMALDTDGWGTGFDAWEIFNGTASAYFVATTASDTPSNGQVPKFNTGGSITWEADNDSGGSTAWNAIGDAAAAGAVAMAETVQTLDWDSAATAAAYDALTLTATHDSTSDADTQRLLVVERLASSGTAVFETLLQIQNNDTDGAVTNGIEILSAAGVITTALNLTDAEIATALAIGSNDITTGATTISSAELDRLDGLANTIVTDNTAVTSVDGAGLTIASGTLNSDGMIIFSGSTTSFSANFYCIPGGDCSTGSGSDDAWTFPMSGTLTNLYFFLKTAPGVGNSWDCSVVINNTASTNLTISTGNASGEFSDTSGSEAITAGDEFGFNCLETGTATATAQVGFSVVFTPS